MLLFSRPSRVCNEDICGLIALIKKYKPRRIDYVNLEEEKKFARAKRAEVRRAKKN